jgi:hypothetical protein
MTPCARAFLEAPPVEEEAVVLLLAVEVEVEVPDDLVTVAVVDVVRVPEDEEIDTDEEVDPDEEGDPVEVRPGPETDVSPGEGVAAPVVAVLPVAVCPLHVAFPAESLPQVSPEAASDLSIMMKLD